MERRLHTNHIMHIFSRHLYQVIKKALIITNTASMVHLFNSVNIGALQNEGYEVHIVPRSSTFKNYGILQTNSTGIIDNSYSGNNDQWLMPIYATKNTIIQRNDRICQFRVVEKQPMIEFDTVEFLDDVDRGSFGSTGKQ